MLSNINPTLTLTPAKVEQKSIKTNAKDEKQHHKVVSSLL